VNILILCAGRRNYLIKYFKDALASGGQVIAVDADPMAPALFEANLSFVVPKFNDPEYVNVILQLCREHHIGLLVSLNDLELPILAEAKNKFKAEGINIVVPFPEVVDICFDKWKTVKFIKYCGLKTPLTCLTLKDSKQKLEKKEWEYPLMIKPRWGSASLHLEIVHNERELQLAYELVTRRLENSRQFKNSGTDSSVLIQEYLKGQEYGLDVVNDLEGKYKATFVKKKLSMRAGETDRAITEDNPALQKVGETLGKKLGHIGNLDCDIFVTKKGIYVLEMNPRFGGGYPFSHVAGANLPAALIAWAQGRKANPEWLTFRPGVAAAKCDRMVLNKKSHKKPRGRIMID